MKSFRLFAVLLAAALTLGGCKAFRTLSGSTLKTAQGRPYELIVVANQPLWTGAVGDSLRALLTRPIPYLPQTEPLFDVLRVTPDGFTNMVVDHRNILKVLVDPALEEAAAGVAYDVTAKPQIVLTLQAPSEEAMTAYLDANGEKLLQILEQAERDRAVAYAQQFGAPGVERAVRERFGVGMHVPTGYQLAADQKDFVWARYEYPTASQGFLVYSYPADEKALSYESLLAARKRFAARIPGPSDGSYMTTSSVFPPEMRMFRLEGRLWVELRGFWDVENDFMGGPFVSYSTIDTATGYVFTYDAYVYAPKLPPHKRNLMRGLEHLFYTISFPKEAAE